ncbi:DUF6232 family protein [Streptomyces sp. NPDC060198]|uniref:DUF6232 family protein n=1 Tax=Streptomyces sp. NPDC060198 TaxID=3347070 RepID=UPI0036549EAF
MLQVTVSRRVLWVGAEAYPLQNIARAQAAMYKPAYADAVASFVRRIVLLALTAGVWFWIVNLTDSKALRTLSLFMTGLLLAASVIRLVRVLLRKTFYALIIETAGSPQTALVSWSLDEVYRLVHMIMDAIDDPNASFSLQVENLHVGDRINQYGNHNAGKVVS